MRWFIYHRELLQERLIFTYNDNLHSKGFQDENDPTSYVITGSISTFDKLRIELGRTLNMTLRKEYLVVKTLIRHLSQSPRIIKYL